MYHSQRAKVLIVDGDQVVANTLKLVLQSSGFEAAVAYRAEEAVRLATEWNPDILLSEAILDTINGFDVAIEVCHKNPECKVVLMSGQNETSDLLARYQESGYSFEVVPKPVPPEDLMARLRNSKRLSM